MTANIVTPSPLTPMGGTAPAQAVPVGRFTPLDPVRVLRQWIWWLLLVAVVGVVIGIGLYFLLLVKAPEYTSEAQLLVTGSLQTPYEEPAAAGAPKQQRLDILSAFIRNQIILVKSDEVLRAAVQNPEIRESNWFARFDGNVEAARIDLNSRFAASMVTGSTLIKLTIKGDRPAELPKLLNAVIDAYLNQFRTSNDVETAEVRAVFRREAERAEQEYQDVVRRLKEFREQNQIATRPIRPGEQGSEFGELAALLEPIDGRIGDEANVLYNDLATQASAMKMRLQSSRESLMMLQQAQAEGRLLDAGADEMAQIEADPAVATRDERLRNLRERREILLHRFGEDHRAVLDVDRTIAATEAEKQREVTRLKRERQAVRIDQAAKAVSTYEGQLLALREPIESARTQILDYQEKVAQYNQIAQQATAAASRRNKANDVLYNMQLKGNRPDNAGVRRQIAATVPVLTFPTIGGVVVTTAILLELLAIAIIFLKELTDQRIKSPSDIMLIPHAKIVGTLPDTGEDPIGPSDVENVVQRDPTGLMAESFRQARTTVLAASERDGHRAIMIVGPQPGSGVTSVVNNMALSLAFDGRKCLVIDANFRKPMQHVLFNVASGVGLADVLRGTTSFDNAVVHRADVAIDVLTAGNTANAVPELLEGKVFAALLDECRSKYDIILIDTPPALLTGEAQIIGKQVDAALVVVRATRDKRGMVARLLRQLDGLHATVLGVILNGVRSQSGGYFGKNYKAFYKYRQSSSRMEENLNGETVEEKDGTTV